MKKPSEETAATILVVLLIVGMILIAYNGSKRINKELKYEMTV